MAVEKITKVDMFNAIADFIANTDWERKDEAIEFIEKQIDQLKAKAENLKSRNLSVRLLQGRKLFVT